MMPETTGHPVPPADNLTEQRTGKQSGQPVERRCVFVYGTLRRGEANDITRLLPAPVYVGAASIEGVLYHLGAYPGVLLGGAHGSAGASAPRERGQVVGEVYAITPALEVKLDEIEFIYPQQSDEYAKRELDISVNGQSVRCLVYEINPDYTLGKPVVANGDWVLRGAEPVV